MPTLPVADRHSTGIPALDAHLGGGLLPGTLTVVVGATGIGKTQLGLQFAHAGLQQERRTGVLLDLSSRGDSQNHAGYAQRLFGWPLEVADPRQGPDLDNFFAAEQPQPNYLHLFDHSGRRVSRRDLEFDDWHEWQAEVNAKLRAGIAFLYGAFVRGTQRVVIDGIEPVDRPQDSIQYHLFEYVYHQLIRKDPLWVARDLFRERFRAQAGLAEQHLYDPQRIGCVLLCTSHEAMLEDLISRPLSEGDVLSNANTLIYMGKIREGHRIRRGLYVAKHRGSGCSEQVLFYEIGEQGLRLLED